MTELISDERFWRGVELFNRGDFFQSHEVWEELWLQSEGERREFVQGMIQAAAALHHRSRGNDTGFRRLRAKALSRLAPMRERCFGIELGCFKRRLQALRMADDDSLTGSLPAFEPWIKRACAHSEGFEL